MSNSNPTNLHIQATRSGGPGGQHVNTTDSAVQITHLPTGIMVKCQDGRSQGKNKEKALQILRAKLLEAKIREESEKYSAHRKSLIGSGGREEKIRTYNYPQNRLTDHRVNLTLYNLDQVVAGELSGIVEMLQASEMEDRLAELEAGLSEGLTTFATGVWRPKLVEFRMAEDRSEGLTTFATRCPANVSSCSPPLHFGSASGKSKFTA
jgi:protein subunit release factor A